MHAIVHHAGIQDRDGGILVMATLFGLYDIMQTLEIVPLEGERERKAGAFVLTGKNAKLQSYTQVQLRGPVRVVEDPAASSGYKVEVGPFPGWKDVPTW